jgi:hypothetical protein
MSAWSVPGCDSNDGCVVVVNAVSSRRTGFQRFQPVTLRIVRARVGYRQAKEESQGNGLETLETRPTKRCGQRRINIQQR